MPPGLSGCQRPRTESTFAFRRRSRIPPFPERAKANLPALSRRGNRATLATRAPAKCHEQHPARSHQTRTPLNQHTTIVTSRPTLALPLPPMAKTPPFFLPNRCPPQSVVRASPAPVGAQAPGPPVPAWTRGVAGGRGERFRVTRPVPRPLIYRAREQRPPQITWKRGRSRGKACGPCSHLRAVGERLTMSARSFFSCL